ncbi:hypothetical protein FBU59_000418 [Linderina macrospora]|uniref:Uncharacterized protein n=1 Tax=Linderina macrospora TaxID=4868 RepID=A0ACC1JGW2_9FUNG|nr:hypothetical protein FBU59_000418 [Linderina macrospora]
MYEGLNPSATQSISDNAQDGSGGSDHHLQQQQQQAEAAAKRRSVNSSKRAAQNRAAQRAFRLRREKYVTSLEDKARRYDKLEAAYMELQKANFEMQGQIQELRHENARLRSRLTSGSPSPSVRPTSFSPSGPHTPTVGSMVPVGPHMPISQDSARQPPPPPPPPAAARHTYAYSTRPEGASYPYEYSRPYGPPSGMSGAVPVHQGFSPQMQPHMSAAASQAPRPAFTRPAPHHPPRHSAAQHMSHHSAHVRHNPSPPPPGDPGKHQVKQAAGLITPPFRPAGMAGPHTPNLGGSSQMLPSMRELTMSIASSLPTSPHTVDPAQQSHFHHSQPDPSRNPPPPPDAGSDAAMDDADQKRRPW